MPDYRRHIAEQQPSRAYRFLLRNSSGAPSGPQTRQLSDVGAGFLFGHPQFVQLLQIQPELATRAEEMPEPQRRISGNRALPVDDLRDPVGGHAYLASKLGSAHSQNLELFGEMFAGVNGSTHFSGLNVLREIFRRMP